MRTDNNPKNIHPSTDTHTLPASIPNEGESRRARMNEANNSNEQSPNDASENIAETAKRSGATFNELQFVSETRKAQLSPLQLNRTDNNKYVYTDTSQQRVVTLGVVDPQGKVGDCAFDACNESLGQLNKAPFGRSDIKEGSIAKKYQDDKGLMRKLDAEIGQRDADSGTAGTGLTASEMADFQALKKQVRIKSAPPLSQEQNTQLANIREKYLDHIATSNEWVYAQSVLFDFMGKERNVEIHIVDDQGKSIYSPESEQGSKDKVFLQYQSLTDRTGDDSEKGHFVALVPESSTPVKKRKRVTFGPVHTKVFEPNFAELQGLSEPINERPKRRKQSSSFNNNQALQTSLTRTMSSLYNNPKGPLSGESVDTIVYHLLRHPELHQGLASMSLDEFKGLFTREALEAKSDNGSTEKMSLLGEVDFYAYREYLSEHDLSQVKAVFHEKATSIPSYHPMPPQANPEPAIAPTPSNPEFPLSGKGVSIIVDNLLAHPELHHRVESMTLDEFKDLFTREALEARRENGSTEKMTFQGEIAFYAYREYLTENDLSQVKAAFHEKAAFIPPQPQVNYAQYSMPPQASYAQYSMPPQANYAQYTMPPQENYNQYSMPPQASSKPAIAPIPEDPTVPLSGKGIAVIVDNLLAHPELHDKVGSMTLDEFKGLFTREALEEARRENGSTEKMTLQGEVAFYAYREYLTEKDLDQVKAAFSQEVAVNKKSMFISS